MDTLTLCFIISFSASLVFLFFTFRRLFATRRQAERERQQLTDELTKAQEEIKAQKKVLAHLSHDVRTPLNSIIGITTIASAHLEDQERLVDCMTKIIGASNHLLAIVNDINSDPAHRQQTVHETTVVQHDVPAAFSSVDFSKKRILLAEDNPLNLEIALEILSMTGAEVDTAVDGVEEVRLFEVSAVGYYDIILTDIQMPNMNGLQAAQTIRQLDRPDAVTVPIIAVTANTQAEDVDLAHKAGMNGFLPKPFELNDLLSILKKNL